MAESSKWLCNLASAVRRGPARYFAYRHSHLRSLMTTAGYSEIHDGGTAPRRVVLFAYN